MKIPVEVYTFTILNSFNQYGGVWVGSSSNEPIADVVLMTRRHIQIELESFINRNNLLLIYPSDAVLVGGRPRWKNRMQTVIDRLMRHGCIQYLGHGSLGKHVNYSITGKGLTIIKDLQLMVGETGCYLAAINGCHGIACRLDHSAIPYELKDNRCSHAQSLD